MKQLRVFSFWNSCLKSISRHEKIFIDAFNIDGGRKSGKTQCAMLFINEAMNVYDINGDLVKVSAVLYRYTKEGAKDSFIE